MEVTQATNRNLLKYITGIVVIFLVCIFFGVYFFSYSQPSLPSKKQVSLVDYVAETKASDIKSILLLHNPILGGCYAVFHHNKSICEANSDPRLCYQEYLYYILLDSSLRGSCETYRKEVREFANRFGVTLDYYLDACEKLKAGEIMFSEVDEYSEIFFNSLYKKDVNLCLSLQKLAEVTQSGCEKSIFEYWAVKENNENYCKNISSLYGQEQCKAFVNKNCDEVIEQLARDWSYFSLAREFKNTTICNNIYHQEIKNLCLDTTKDYNTTFRTFGNGETMDIF